MGIDICDPKYDQLTFLPIRFPTLHAKYVEAVKSYWTVDEVELASDMPDWRGLKDSERHFIKHVLAFFAASDKIVTKNLSNNFLEQITINEAQNFYAFQAMIEVVHSEMYSKLLYQYVTDESERMRLLNSVEEIPEIAAKAKWMLKWYNKSSAPIGHRVLAFAIAEGIFFSGSFCAIYWLKHRGVMPGLTHSNELISRDEGLHTGFGCLMYNMCNTRMSDADAATIFREAVEIECDFCEKSLPVELIGMNSEMMKQYIRFVADHLLGELGHPAIFHAANPFPWMKAISLGEIHTNFFEGRVGEYQMASWGTDGAPTTHKARFEAAF